MTVPGIGDFSDVGFNDQLRFADLTLVEPNSDCQMNIRCQPEFCLAVRMGDMNMNTCLFPRKEEQTKLTITQDCWCHVGTLHRGALP